MNILSNKYFFDWRSVIVTAESHNPTLLNPDFLKRNYIIPEDWEISETFTTPPFSVVRSGSISISIEQNRLQVIEKVLNFSIPEKSDIYNITSKIINLLSHVRYKSLGLNWSIYNKTENNDKWMLNRFLSNDIKEVAKAELFSCNFTLKYNIIDALLSLTVAPMKVNFNELKGDHINFNANYSHEIPEKYIEKRKMIEYIDQGLFTWKEKEQYLQQHISSILGE